MAKNKKSRTQNFLLKQTNKQPPLPSPEQINQVIAKATGQTTASKKRIPLTTSITPEHRAKLEVSALQSQHTIADILHQALHQYFAQNNPLQTQQTQQQYETFLSIYNQKATK